MNMGFDPSPTQGLFSLYQLPMIWYIRFVEYRLWENM
jgi:hypothetical protein